MIGVWPEVNVDRVTKLVGGASADVLAAATASLGFWLRRWLQNVAASTSVWTRSGCLRTSSCAIIPPIEMPKTCAFSTPAAASTRTASSAMSRTRKRPRGAVE